MRNGYKVTLGMLTVMILLVITVGTSYSYYSVSSEQTDPNTMATTCFQFEFQDQNSINLNAAYPIEDASANSKLTPYQFTITNTCTGDVNIKYDVTLNTLLSSASNLPDNKIKYKLDVTAPSAVAGTNKMLNTAYSADYDLASEIKTSNDLDKVYKLESGTLAGGESKTFNLRLWLDSSAGNEVMGKTFNGKILVYAYM